MRRIALDFDFSRIAVPFRMQPGLLRLAEGTPQLTPLDPGSALHAEKRLVVQAGQSRHCVAGFDPTPAIDSIAARARLMRAGEQFDTQTPLELAFEEDFAVLDGATGTLPWLCVCVPSHWAPEDKLGLDFAALHGPVADNAALLAASRQLVALATGGECWERFVWTVTPSPRYDQHPRRHPRDDGPHALHCVSALPPEGAAARPGAARRRAPWPATQDAEAFAAQCFLRAERQTFFPVGQSTRQAVFTIRVMLGPLVQVANTPAKARRLHDSLASMSDGVLAYKGLLDACPRLLRWLKARTG